MTFIHNFSKRAKILFPQRIFNSPSWKANTYSINPRLNISTSSSFKEQKVKVGNYEINYLKAGRGPHHVFCAGGFMTTIWDSFGKQIKGFNHDEFSLIVWDTPGFGKSIALGDTSNESFNRFAVDADIAYEFMKAIEIPKYSVMGWSRGGPSCLLLASRHHEVVNKVVVWGASSFLLPKEVEYYKNLRKLEIWPQQIKDEMVKLYGEESFIKKLNEFVDAMVMYHDEKQSICDDIKDVKSLTLLLHGAKDHVVDISHLKHLHGLIENSREHLYPDGKHDIHIKYADDFNKRVQEFLLS